MVIKMGLVAAGLQHPDRWFDFSKSLVCCKAIWLWFVAALILVYQFLANTFTAMIHLLHLMTTDVIKLVINHIPTDCYRYYYYKSEAITKPCRNFGLSHFFNSEVGSASTFPWKSLA